MARNRGGTGPAATAPSHLAGALLERWSHLAQGHISTGGGCSCGGASLGHLRMQDFEQDILDYLNGRYAGDAALQRLLQDKAGYRPGSAGSLEALLRALADPTAAVPAETPALLADLERSLASFDNVHHGH